MQSSSSKTLVSHLLRIQAIKLNAKSPFTWASGIRSPIYCDNRISLSYPEVRDYIKDGFVEKMKDFGEIDAIVGVATAGIPHGMLLAQALNKPFAYVRSKSKAHGRQNQIEGHLEGGQKVVMIEDLFSTGGSAIKAADALKDINVEIKGILAIFTYGFEIAKQNFQSANLHFDTLADYEDMIAAAIETNYIDQDQMELLREWRKDPSVWYDNNF